MKIALCNEVIADRPFAAQCALAAALGYDGLELAPFTLAPAPHRIARAKRALIRRMAADAGLEITSLHWLLVRPKGLSINTPDRALRLRTVEVMRALIELAHDFGAKVMVHGSPMARQIPEGADPAPFRERALDSFARIAPDAEAAGITYCIEPLAASETNFLNTLAEAKAMLDELASPALRTMIDTCAAAQAEAEPVAAVIARWLPTGLIAHVQVNDRNRAGPGQGGDQFAPILAALARARYHGAIAVEPFVYKPDGAGAAARAIGYLRGILEAQAHPTHRNPQS